MYDLAAVKVEIRRDGVNKPAYFDKIAAVFIIGVSKSELTCKLQMEIELLKFVILTCLLIFTVKWWIIHFQC